MSSRLIEIFEDEKLVEKIKRRLPYLFQLAELESSRAGKTGIEVGSVRERIIVALLIYKFGEANVETEIPITEPEVDAKLFGEPVSIKVTTQPTLLQNWRRSVAPALPLPNPATYIFGSFRWRSWDNSLQSAHIWEFYSGLFCLDSIP